MKVKPRLTTTPKIFKRRSISGKLLVDLDESQNLTINTKCPEKWVFVDIEDSNCWSKRDEDDRWQVPDIEHLKDARRVITREINALRAMEKEFS